MLIFYFVTFVLFPGPSGSKVKQIKNEISDLIRVWRRWSDASARCLISVWDRRPVGEGRRFRFARFIRQQRTTRSYLMSGQELPAYNRDESPFRFAFFLPTHSDFRKRNKSGSQITPPTGSVIV